MTINERRAREQRERENPWRAIGEAKPDGSICELRMNNLTELRRHRFFLHEGRWFRIEPPGVSYHEGLVEFRPTGFTISKDRQSSVIERSDGRFEYRGGELYTKPKPYKFYWRAEEPKGKK